jgi:hypothetical protein
MKIIISTFFLFCTFFTYGQITFEDVLSFENKSFKEIQASLFEDYAVIDDDKDYYYFPIRECNPPQFKEDNCQWICTEPNHLDAITSKFPLDKVEFRKSSNKNYEVWLNLQSTFGENYSSVTKKATTFIKVSERKAWSNNNCKSEMIEGNGHDSPLTISIQFSNPVHWKSFKSSVTRNTTFNETWQPSKESPVEFRYGIKRKQTESGSWLGVFVNLYESGSTYHASISFNSYGVN